jgi:hypothetical protein
MSAFPQRANPSQTAGRVSVSKDSIDSTKLIKPSFSRLLAATAIFTGPLFTIAIGLVTWWSTQHSHVSIQIVLVGDVFGAIVALLLTLYVARLTSNYGVAVEKNGISVYEQALSRERLTQQSRDWSEISGVEIHGVLGESVEFRSPQGSLWLERSQARLIMGSPDCDIKAGASQDVIRALRGQTP